MEPFYKGLFVQGAMIGFAIAAPVGPIGILCIGRTLTEGRLRGLATGIGAATADSMYGAIAGLGLHAVQNLLLQQFIWIRLLGGCLLCFMGYKMARAKIADQEQKAHSKSIVSAFISAFLLTLTNPMTLLAFAAVFSGLRLQSLQERPEDFWWLVLGVFLGSSVWWVMLSMGTGIFHKRLSPRGLRWVNWISGGVIVCFGLFTLFAPAPQG